jgi:malate dehydrogenase (oxaloacetate-decarboxylating)(NADP+)
VLSEPAPGFRYRRDQVTKEEYLEVPIRGEMLADFPMFNKGTAFTESERDDLGLRGLLPPRVVPMEQQVARVMENYSRKSTDLERYIHLIALLDRNETLFHRILLDRLEELLPIVYTPTVGLACQQFGHIYRRPRGIYVTPEDVGRIDALLANWPFQEIAVIVVTDGERVLGLGDLGAGGMGISIGKISLYVTGAGIHPARTLPVCLDVGTNNERLLEDPLYLGQRRRRLRGPEYDALVEAFFAAASRRFPKALIQFEDFGKANAFRLLDGFRDRYRTFNDDIQGTGAVTLAGVLSGLRQTGGRLEDQRVLILGAGSAGVGIARALKASSIWMLDSKGLLTTDRDDLTAVQKTFARSEPAGGLLEVARRIRPTVLIGTSGQPGVFSREVVETLAGERPMVFPLSNPTSKSECTPEQARAWTSGRALIATGSPFAATSQCNNMYIFPGVGLGVVASGADRVTDEMFIAAARELASLSPGGALYPPLSEIRRIASRLALAVAREAIRQERAEPCSDEILRARIASEVWEPRYLPYRAAEGAVSREQTLRKERG